MSPPLMSSIPPLVNPSGRRITIDLLPTGVIGEENMQISYAGIPEGWGFVCEKLLDAVKASLHEWGRSKPQLVIQGNGEKH